MPLSNDQVEADIDGGYTREVVQRILAAKDEGLVSDKAFHELRMALPENFRSYLPPLSAIVEERRNQNKEIKVVPIPEVNTCMPAWVVLLCLYSDRTVESFQNVGREIPCKHLKTVLSRNTGDWKPRLCKRCHQIQLHAMLETEIAHRLKSLVTVTYITYQTSRPAMMTFDRSHKMSMFSVSNYQFNYNHFEVKCETTFQIFLGAKQAEIMT